MKTETKAGGYAGTTPGPWEVEGASATQLRIRAALRFNVCKILRLDSLAETKANALLIAAAPALLEASESLIELWDSWAINSSALYEPLRRSLEMRIEEARAAIAAATGGQS